MNKTPSTTKYPPASGWFVNLFLIYVATGFLGVYTLGQWHDLAAEVPLTLLGGKVSLVLPKASVFALPILAVALAIYASFIVRRNIKTPAMMQPIYLAMFSLFCCWSFMIEQAWFSHIAGRSRSIDSWLLLIGPIAMILVWKAHKNRGGPRDRYQDEVKRRHNLDSVHSLESLKSLRPGMIFVSRHPKP